MGIFFASFSLDILSITIALLCVLTAYFKYSLTYWARRKVPYIPPLFPYGNIKDVFLQRRSFAECVLDFYKDLKSKGLRFAGFYMLSCPQLLIIDPELVKDILTRNSSYFADRGIAVNEKKDPLTAHLLFIAGHKWKSLRQKLTPTFSSGKIKMMFHTMLACAEGLEGLMDDFVKNKEDINMKEVFGRFTTDIIGSCAFGLDCNSIKNGNSELRTYGRRVFTPTTTGVYKLLMSRAYPELFYFLQFRQIDEEVTNFFMKVVAETIEYREKNNIKRNDFLQLLINIKNTGDVDANANGFTNDAIKDKNEPMNGQGLTLVEITAQCYIFFLAGFEPASNAMALFMFEMSVNQDIQDKVRKEITDMLKKYDGEITYEGIMELPYMDQALCESMRIHTTSPFLFRKCTKEYKIPDSDVVIKKGTKVVIPLNGIHLDPEFYPEPYKYDPERFSKDEQANRHSCTFLPFGQGLRNCVAQRFGLLEIKVGLVVLLKNHRFSLSNKTQLPLKLDPKNNLQSSVSGFWINAERI